jgi:hypothetical protein
VAQIKDVAGQVFGRLRAIGKIGKDQFGIAYWRCECSCGNNTDVRLGALTSGATRSCGCLNQEIRSSLHRGNKYSHKHGLTNHYLYQTWATMKQRCTNPNHAKYYLYGGRGIGVCKEWSESFVKFLEDMGDRPQGHTLNRIDNDGNYCKENCEWQTYSEQNSNRRRYERLKTEKSSIYAYPTN